MEFNLSRLSAWFIVIFGLAVIGWAVFSSYGFFTGQKDFPEIFKSSAVQTGQTQAVQKTEAPAVIKDQAAAQAAVQEQMLQAFSGKLSELFPADSVLKVSNMAAWIAFATFLVFAGGQIAGIGVKILVDIGKA
jgi:hypothetical protein